MINLKWFLKPETLGEMISTQLDDPSLCDVVFLCEDGRTGFPRSLLSPSPSSLLTELLPPPGRDCCEKLLRADQAKVFISLAGVQLGDLKLVLDLILGISKEKMSRESLEVASMMGIPIRRRGVMGDMEELVRDLLDEAVEKMHEEEEEEAMEDSSSLDDLEEELEFSFTGGDDLVDEIICNSSLDDHDGSPMIHEAQPVDLVGHVIPGHLKAQETEPQSVPGTNEVPEETPTCQSQSDAGEAHAEPPQLVVSAQQFQDSPMEEELRPAIEIQVRKKSILIKTINFTFSNN